MTVRSIYGKTLRTYWHQAGFLVLLGAVVFVPLRLLDALADKAQQIDANEVSNFEWVALIAGLSAQGVTSLLGEVFYSGAVAVALTDDRRPGPTLRVRGHFWQVFAVLVSITLAGAVLPAVMVDVIPPIAGTHFLRDWLGEAASSIALSPFFAVAALLLTLELGGRPAA